MWRNIAPFLSKIKKIFVYSKWVGGGAAAALAWASRPRGKSPDVIIR